MYGVLCVVAWRGVIVYAENDRREAGVAAARVSGCLRRLGEGGPAGGIAFTAKRAGLRGDGHG